MIYKIRSSVATECKLNQLVYTCYVKDLDPWPAPTCSNSTTQPEMMTESIVTATVLEAAFYQSLSG